MVTLEDTYTNFPLSLVKTPPLQIPVIGSALSIVSQATNADGLYVSTLNRDLTTYELEVGDYLNLQTSPTHRLVRVAEVNGKSNIVTMPDLKVTDGTSISAATSLNLRYDELSSSNPAIQYELDISVPIVFDFVEYQG